MGVLVAISIPIFTSQLRKARLATNQANARAAYAAATAQYLTEDDTPEDPVSYVYTIDTATLGKQQAGGTAKITTPIADWKVGDDAGVVLGDKTAGTWTVELNADGSLIGFTAAE